MDPVDVLTSAPAKIILFGEHSVTYGKVAVTTAADLRATCHIRLRPQPWVSLSGGGHSQKVSLDRLAAFRQRIDDLRAADSHTEIRRLTQDDFFAPARYILGTALASSEPVGLDISFESDIPIGSGLGSGGAVFAALAWGLTKLLYGEPSRRQAADWAYLGDVIAHGGIASGTDTSTSVYGGFIRFSTEEGAVPVETSVQPVIVIGDTLRRAVTSEVNGRVRRWLDEDAVRYHYFDKMDTVARLGMKALADGDLPALGHLMNINQVLLEKIGVSCPEIDTLCNAALRAGALGAKLSGSGGGGIVIALATADIQTAVAEAIEAAGGQALIVRVGVPGVMQEV